MLTYLKLSTFFQEVSLEDWSNLGEQNSQRQVLHTNGVFLIYLIIYKRPGLTSMFLKIKIKQITFTTKKSLHSDAMPRGNENHLQSINVGRQIKMEEKECTQPVRVHKHTCRHTRKKRAKNKWIRKPLERCLEFFHVAGSVVKEKQHRMRSLVLIPNILNFSKKSNVQKPEHISNAQSIQLFKIYNCNSHYN